MLLSTSHCLQLRSEPTVTTQPIGTEKDVHPPANNGKAGNAY